MDTVVFEAREWLYEETSDDGIAVGIIHIAGLTKHNKNVAVKVVDFKPFVYLQLPKMRRGWTRGRRKLLVDFFKKRMDASEQWARENRNPDLASCKLVSAIPWNKYLLHYSKKVSTLKIAFSSNSGCRSLEYICQRAMTIPGVGAFKAGEFTVHESNVDPIIKFTAINKILLSGWIKVTGTRVRGDEKFNCSKYNMLASWKGLIATTVSKDIFTTPKLFSFDIECNSTNHDSKLPDPHIHGNVVFQVAVVTGRVGSSSYKNMLLSLFDPLDIEGVEIIRCKNEKELLLKFSALIQSEDPDLFVGYNTMKFDWNYMVERAKLLGCLNRYLDMSRSFEERAKIRSLRWFSAAYGQQEFLYPECIGRMNVDILLEVQMAFRLPKYSLNFVAEKFLGEQKDDITPRQLFMLYQITHELLSKVSGKVTKSQLRRAKKYVERVMLPHHCHGVVEELRASILEASASTIYSHIQKAITLTGSYCVQDTILPINLLNKLNLWTTMKEMSNVMHIPSSYLHTRGQQIKVLAQVYRETIDRGYIIPYQSKLMKDGYKKTKFQGATVIDAVTGDYDNVGTLDFASLYPTVMISFNICYTTFVAEDDPISDDLCHVLEWSEHVKCGCPKDKRLPKDKKKKRYCAEHRYRFRKVQYEIDDDGNVTRLHEGLLPRLERNLLATRREIKKEMAKVDARLAMNRGKADEKTIEYYRDKCGYEIIKKGSLSKEEDKLLEVLSGILNAKQLAVKVSANSVGGNTPVPCLIDGEFKYLQIEHLFNEKAYEEDEDGNQVTHACDISLGRRVKVWSDKGWTSVKHVIRHRIREPLVRVLTHTGCVDVTTGHSLLRDTGESVTTPELEVGDRLMHETIPLPKDTPKSPKYRALTDAIVDSHKLTTMEQRLAFAKGLFMAEGTCGIYGALGTRKSNWCIYNKDLALLTRTSKFLNRCTPEDVRFEVKDYGVYDNTLPDGTVRKDTHIYYLKMFGCVHKYCKEWRADFYTSRKEKKMPDYILTAKYSVRLAFFLGYYRGDGSHHLKTGVVMNNRGQLACAHLAYLARSVGYDKVSVSFSNREEKNKDIFRLQCSTKFRITDSDAIKKVVLAPLPPPILSTESKVVRNGVHIVPSDDGSYMYKGIKIKCERVPRQKLLDSLDLARSKSSTIRGRFVSYDTSTKSVTCVCDSCGVKTNVRLVVLHKTPPVIPRAGCKCTTKLIKSKKSVEIKKDEDYTEYIYDLETKNHHFAAGVGDMIVHNSMYGTLGARTGPIPLIEGAASVTAMGRFLIERAIDRVLQEYETCMLVYGDTDSCMIHFKGASLRESFRLSIEAGEIATHALKSYILGLPETYEVNGLRLNKITPNHPEFDLLTKEEKINVIAYDDIPIDLEFENMYGRFLLLTKKRYLARSYNVDGKVISVTKKGVVITRRDNSNILKCIYTDVSNAILDKMPKDIVYQPLYDGVTKLFTRQVQEKDFIIYMGVKDVMGYAKKKKIDETKEGGKEYYVDKDENPIVNPIGPLDPRLNYPNIPQCLLSLKMISRGTDIPPNTRLEFLYIRNPDAQHQGDKAEDYLYFKENKAIEGFKIDELHYLEKQILKPVTELLVAKFPPREIPFETLKGAVTRVVTSKELMGEYRYNKICTAKTHTRVVSYEVGVKEWVVGWTALRHVSKRRAYMRFVDANSVMGIDTHFTREYIHKTLHGKVWHIFDSVKRGGPNDFNPKYEKDREVIETAKRWWARVVLDRTYKHYGMKRRREKRPSTATQRVAIGTKVTLLRNHENVPKCTVGEVVCSYKESEDDKAPILHDIIFDVNKEKIRLEEVQRELFTPFIKVDSTPIHDMLVARVAYRAVIEHLDRLFSPFIYVE